MLIDFQKIPVLWYGGIKPWRQKKIEDMFHRLNINAIHIDPIVSDSCRIGSMGSHLKALKVAANINGPVLILEDDASETQWYSQTYTIPDDTDAFYFGTCHNGLHPLWYLMGQDEGCCGDPIALETYLNYYRIHNMLGGHAILYCSESYKHDAISLLEDNYGKKFFDVIFAAFMNKYRIYAPKEPLFYQDCEQDNYDAWIKTKTPLRQLLN